MEAGLVIRMATTPWVALDVETTGLQPSTDRVVEVALVRSDGLSWSSLIDPGCDPGPSHAHGIFADDLIGAPAFADVAPEIAEMLDEHIIAGHNINFDFNFLRYEFKRIGIELPRYPLLDTARAAWALRRISSGDSRTLAALCAREGIDATGPHSAGWDAGLVALLVHRYTPLAGGWLDMAVHPLKMPEPLYLPITGSKAMPRK